MTRLQDLYEIGGQSPWLDNLRRDWLEGGQLAELLALGVRGITSNPTIFANAISGQDTYDDQFRALMKDHTVEGAYWEMAITDIDNALDMLRPLYDESDGEDGFVSLEVSPAQAHETEDTLKAARDLHAAHRPAQPLRQGAGDQGGRAGHRDADRRGPQHQRHADLRPRPLRRGDGGLPAAASRHWWRPAARTSWPRWPAWPPSSSAGSTPRSTAAWRPWPAGRRVTPPSSACAAPPRWPRRRRPTNTSTAPSPATAGRRCGPRAPGCSGRCGRPPRPRTPATRTCSTSTA